MLGISFLQSQWSGNDSYHQDRYSHFHDIVISNYNADVPKQEPLGLKNLYKSKNILVG